MFDLLPDFFRDESFIRVIKFLYYSAVVWVPAILGWILWDLWISYRRAQFFAKQKYILLEIKLPREQFKSPQAMEFFISGLFSTAGEGNWYEKYWKGQVRAWFSLEIVSISGSVHFFIWTRSGAKNQIEANLYSQFPGIEIYEVPDYTLPISFDTEKVNIWATEFDLTKRDCFPIKTYIDYELEKNPKEEYKIDPMTPLIEAMGALGKGHQAWLQIIVRAHKEEDRDPKTGKMVDARWRKAAQEEIESIIKKTKGEKDADGKLIPGSGRTMTESESMTIKALERSVSKTGFDVGMRMLYIAEKDLFNPANIGGLVGGVTHFNSSLNGFRPARGSAAKHKNIFLVWKDRNPLKIQGEKQGMLDAYKRRAYFYKPFKSPHFVLNTEEIATIFHFPGSVSSTPTFQRVDSRKSEAPPNIPI